jgi:hypothetical protein
MSRSPGADDRSGAAKRAARACPWSRLGHRLDSLFDMAQRKGVRKRPLREKITRTCASCGAALAAGAVCCATCLVAAGSAQAALRPPEVVKVSVPNMEPLRYVPFAEMREPGRAGWAPADRFDDHDLPELDGTFYTSGVFAGGTAIATTTPRVRPGGLR